MATNDFLEIEIDNNGSPKYRTYYRKRGSGDPWAGGRVTDAIAGDITTVVYQPVDPGEYEVRIISICADGSESEDSPLFYSKPCPAPRSFNVIQKSPTEFLISYTLPPLVTVYNLRILYPNGGTFDQVFTADSTGQRIIPIPANTYGDFTFSLRSVCNDLAGWYSVYSPSVLIEIPSPAICQPPFISGSARVNTGPTGDTWRITLGGQTTSVRVYIKNVTTGADQTLNQPVTGNYIEVFLARNNAISYLYSVQIFNICPQGTDIIGDQTDISVPATLTPVDTSGWTVATATETVPVGGVLGFRVTVNTNGQPPSGTQDCLVSVRYTCTGGAQAFVQVVIAAGQSSGVARNYAPPCTIDITTAFVQSATLL